MYTARQIIYHPLQIKGGNQRMKKAISILTVICEISTLADVTAKPYFQTEKQSRRSGISGQDMSIPVQRMTNTNILL